MNNQFRHQTLYLNERVNLLRKKTRRKSITLYKVTDIARKLIKTWKKKTGLDNTVLFKKRLEQDGISEVDFIKTVAQRNDDSSPHIGVRDLPSSIRVFELLEAAAFASPNAHTSNNINSEVSYSFSILLVPFIRHAIKELENKLAALKSKKPQIDLLWLRIRSELIKDLEESLLKKVTPSLVLELNIARLDGNLVGINEQERFNYFCQTLAEQKGFLKFFKQYPVLARLLTESITNWVELVIELLTRLITDWSVIEVELLKQTKLTDLTTVRMSLSDVHRNGRTVCELTFVSNQKIIYKPKSLQIDLHFQDFLRWLNNHGVVPTFQTIRIIDRGTYGWTEHVSQKGCSNLEEVNRFYERQGGYLAILYALGGTDMHRENLIAHGEHPILVDLETIFHHQLLPSKKGGALKKALKLFDESVMKTGLLPTFGWDPESDADYSGLGGKAVTIATHHWENKNTDEMRLVSGLSKLNETKNRVLLNNVEIEPESYIESITKGFENIYRVMMRQQDELLDKNGPISVFATDTIRQVFRGTRIYHLYLEKGYHPDNLQNGLDRDRLMDRLWARALDQSKFETIITSERHDLLCGDIPIFTSQPNSLDLYDSKNRCIKNFFDKDSLSMVKARISTFNENGLTKQLWFIRSAFAVSNVSDQSEINKKSVDQKRISRLAKKKEFLEAAIGIGHRLRDIAIVSGPEAMWIGPTLLPNGRWSLMPVGYDLYSGTAGIALFLGYLGRESKNEQFTKLSRAAIRGAAKQLLYKEYKYYENMIPSSQLNSPGGGFTGSSSVIYAMLHLGTLWKDDVLLDEALTATKNLGTSISNDEQLDILGGLAGYILVLIDLHKQTGAQSPLDLAIQCGELLLNKSELRKNGRVWQTTFLNGGLPLSGLSHGNAGFAYSLLKLGNATSEERFKTASYEALNYERTLFSKVARNWQDLRIINSPIANINEKKFATAWCNGAPGIALARLFSLRYYKKLRERNKALVEIETSLSTTIVNGFNGDHSLCHGGFGNLEVLLVASEVLKRQSLKKTATTIATQMLDEITQGRWKYGGFNDIETPGLMTGLAGIGFGLLRTSSPSTIPSILVLEPPYHS